MSALEHAEQITASSKPDIRLRPLGTKTVRPTRVQVVRFCPPGAATAGRPPRLNRVVVIFVGRSILVPPNPGLDVTLATRLSYYALCPGACLVSVIYVAVYVCRRGWGSGHCKHQRHASKQGQ